MQDEDRSAAINPEQLAEIEQNLRSTRLNHRWAAVIQLAAVPAAVAVPIFKRLLNEKDVGLRRLAVVGLGKHLSEESLQTLQTILAGPGDPMIVAEAANSIFEFGDLAIPLLQDLFGRSSHWLVRQTIISALVETDRYEVILAVAQIALTDQTKAVRELGILALKRVLQSPLQAAAVEILSELARDPDWQIRWCTAISLHGCPETHAKELIAQLQQDEDFRVVAAALEGLTNN